MNSVIEKVETFIQRLHDLDYIIAQKASELMYVNPSGPKKEKSLADSLANKIHLYEKNRDSDEHKLSSARTCNIWINRAFTQAVVQEGQGLVGKLKECREKKAELEKELEKVSAAHLALQKENEILSRIMKLPDNKDLEDKR